MLNRDDLKLIEGAHRFEDIDWTAVHRLSESLRHSWVQCAREKLDDSPVELAVGAIGSATFVIVATTNGQVRLFDSANQQLREVGRLQLGGFEPSRDEIRNILLSRRRHSSELDVFITVRRWPHDSSPPAHCVWRAAIWMSADGVLDLRAITEGKSASIGESWSDIAGHQLPKMLFDTPIQFAPDVDALAESTLNRLEQRASADDERPKALSANTQSIASTYADGRVCWGGQVIREERSFAAPSAMGLSSDNQYLITTGRDGQLHRYRNDSTGKMSCETHDLEFDPVVLGVMNYATAEDDATKPALHIVLAARDGQLVLWECVGNTRILDTWRRVVEQTRAQLTDRKIRWTEWAAELSSDVRVPANVRQMLWLHAAWDSDELTLQLRQFAHTRGQHRPGTLIGQELARLMFDTAPTLEQWRRGLALYASGGHALREQLDHRGLPEAESAWQAADSGERSARYRAAIGNLATRPFVWETTFTRNARRIANSPNGLWVAGETIDLLHLDADRPTHAVRSLAESHAKVPSIERTSRWLRCLKLGLNRSGIAVGADKTVTLEIEGKEKIVLRDDALRSLPTLVDAATSANAVHLILPWEDDFRTWLQPAVFERRDKRWTEGERQLLPVPAKTLDLTSVNGEQWLVVGTRSWTLHWYRRETDGWKEFARNRLDSPVQLLRFDANDSASPSLICATRRGRIWCFDVQQRVRWCHDAYGRVRSIDLAGSASALQVAVCSTPHWLTVLDFEGRRIWRHRVDRPRSVAMVGIAADGWMPRIALLHDRDKLSIFRRPEAAVYLRRVKELAETDADSDRLRVARAIALGRLGKESVQAILRPEARRALLALAVRQAGWQTLLALDLQPADIAAMAREWRPDQPLVAWEQLWQRGLLFLADHTFSPTELSAMLAELLSALRRRKPSLAYVCDQFDALRGPGEDILANREDAAIAGAHAWIDAVDAAPGQFAEAVLRQVHRLPLQMAKMLKLYLPDRFPPGPSPSSALHTSIRALLDLTEAAQAELGELRFAPNPKASSPLLHFLRAAACLVHQPDWRAALDLMLASSVVAPGRGPLVAMARLPTQQLPGNEWPEDHWRLDRQERWLVAALGRRWTLPMGDAGWPGWQQAVEQLGSLLEHAFRTAVLAQLTDVLTRTRPRLEAQVLNWTGDQVLLGLKISHEGKHLVEHPTIKVEVVQTSGESVAAVDLQLSRLAQDDPPHQTTLRFAVPPGTRDLSLRMRCSAPGRNDDVSHWPLVLGQATSTVAQQSLLLLPPIWPQIKQTILKQRGGIGILIVDSPLQPEELISTLSELPDTATVPLDLILKDLGPGRTYPNALSAGALLRAIAGFDPLDDSLMPDGQMGSGRGRMLLPCRDVFNRWMAATDRSTLEAFIEHLRSRARSVASPTLWFVLPAYLGTALHADLADTGSVLLHPAHVDVLELPTKESETLMSSLARSLGCDPLEAKLALNKAGGDLRVLIKADESLERLAWLRADLCGLAPAELMALVALSRAQAKLALDKVPAHAIAAETVVSDVRVASNQNKVLIRDGERVTDTARVHSIRKHLLVRGLASATELDHVEEEARRLLDACGFNDPMLRRLIRLGVIDDRKSLKTLRTDIQQWLDRFRTEGRNLTQAVETLGDEHSQLRALSLPGLVHADERLLTQLNLDASSARLSLFRAIGQLWSSTVLRPAVAQALAQAMLGLPPESTGTLSADVVRVRVPLRFLPAHDVLQIDFARSSTGLAETPAEPGVLAMVCGPAADVEQAQDARVRIGEAQIREILRASDIRSAFWTNVRAQLDLTALSPFRHAAALPPGSPLFVGRSAIRQQIQAGLKSRSFMILGARQVGKTSLLHQVLHDAQQRADVDCVKLDLQGIDSAEEFVDALREALSDKGVVCESRTLAGTLSALEQASAPRMPVLLINEVDGLLQKQPSVIQQLRARHEAQRMRFVFVGYAPVLWSLTDVGSPFYHFTSGDTDGAFVLGPLDEPDCRQLLQSLCDPPLVLQWADARHREKGEALLISAACRVPWALQDLCHALVARMHGERRALMELEDVRRVVDSRPSFLERMQKFDLADAMGRGGRRGEGSARVGGRLLLALVIRDRYRDAISAMGIRELAASDPQARAFTAVDALRCGDAGLKHMPLSGDELRQVLDWMHDLPLARFFSTLTLSIILAPARKQYERAWHFQSHIYPLELLRDLSQHRRTLDDLVLDLAQDLLESLAND